VGAFDVYQGRCDLCGAEGYCNELLESYRENGIRYVCHNCEEEVNTVLTKMRLFYGGIVSRALKRFIRLIRLQKGRRQRKIIKERVPDVSPTV